MIVENNHLLEMALILLLYVPFIYVKGETPLRKSETSNEFFKSLPININKSI